MYVISINFCSNWHCSYFNFSVYMPKMSYTEIWNWETLFSTWDPERLLWPIFAWVNIWWMKMIFWRTKEGHQPIFLLMYWVGSLMLENRQVKNMNYQFHEIFYCFSLLFFQIHEKKIPFFQICGHWEWFYLPCCMVSFHFMIQLHTNFFKVSFYGPNK